MLASPSNASRISGHNFKFVCCHIFHVYVTWHICQGRGSMVDIQLHTLYVVQGMKVYCSEIVYSHVFCLLLRVGSIINVDSVCCSDIIF